MVNSLLIKVVHMQRIDTPNFFRDVVTSVESNPPTSCYDYLVTIVKKVAELFYYIITWPIRFFLAGSTSLTRLERLDYNTPMVSPIDSTVSIDFSSPDVAAYLPDGTTPAPTTFSHRSLPAVQGFVSLADIGALPISQSLCSSHIEVDAERASQATTDVGDLTEDDLALELEDVFPPLEDTSATIQSTLNGRNRRRASHVHRARAAMQGHRTPIPARVTDPAHVESAQRAGVDCLRRRIRHVPTPITDRSSRFELTPNSSPGSDSPGSSQGGTPLGIIVQRVASALSEPPLLSAGGSEYLSYGALLIEPERGDPDVRQTGVEEERSAPAQVVLPVGIYATPADRFLDFSRVMATEFIGKPGRMIFASTQRETTLGAWHIPNSNRIVIETVRTDDPVEEHRLELVYDLTGEFTQAFFDGRLCDEGLPILAETWIESAIAASEEQDLRLALRESVPPQAALSESDITILAAVLRRDFLSSLGGLRTPLVFLVEDVPYAAYYRNGTNQIILMTYEDWHTSDRSKELRIRLDRELKIENVELAGVDFGKDIPVETQNTIDQAFAAASGYIARVESHNARLRVSVVRNAISRNVSDLVFSFGREYAKVIPVSHDPSVSVHFYTDFLEVAPGVDVGGPLRTFFDELLNALWAGQDANFRVITRDNFPRLVTPVEIDERHPVVPILSPEDAGRYEALGRLMMFLYRDGNFVMGNQTDVAMFAALLTLRAPTSVDQDRAATADLNNLDVLHDRAMLQMMHALSSCETDAYAFTRMCEILLTPHSSMHDDATLEYVYHCIGPDYEFDLERVRANWTDHLRSMKSTLICKYGRELTPIYHIAKGMHSVSFDGASTYPMHKNQAWNAFRASTDPEELSTRIQGEVSRESIAGSFRLDGACNEVIEQKVDWLRAWIFGASDSEVRNFLKFVTGVGSLPPHKKIRVSVGSLSPLPSANTCFYTLKISPTWCAQVNGDGVEMRNDRTQEAFIDALDFAIGNALGFDADAAVRPRRRRNSSTLSV